MDWQFSSHRGGSEYGNGHEPLVGRQRQGECHQAKRGLDSGKTGKGGQDAADRRVLEERSKTELRTVPAGFTVG